MAVKIRLTRTGGTNQASWRLVAADTRSPRDGRCLELLGWYNPGAAGLNFGLKMDRIEYWRGRGAELSDTARSLVKRARDMEREQEPAAQATV